MTNVSKDKIIAALNQLDPANPEHWTDDGLPVTKVVQTLAADLNIKRSDITEVAPGFARDTARAVKFGQAEDAPVEAAPVATAPVATAPTVDPITGVVLKSADEAEYLGDDIRAQFEYKLATATALVETRGMELTAAQRAHTDAIKARDVALRELSAKFPPLSAAENIQQYLASEQRKRIEAAGGAVASQLDRTMATRKAPHGWGGNARQRGQMVSPPAVREA